MIRFVRRYLDLSSRISEMLFCALSIFLLVTATSVPAVLPFLSLDRHVLALRVSNVLLVGLIMFIGWIWAGSINTGRWAAALAMAGGGLVLVQITILLGG